MAIKEDLIAGASGRFTLDGWELERKLVVTGVTGEGYEKLINALNTTGVPELGDAHPQASASRLREAIPKALSSGDVEIRLLYSTPAWEAYPQTADTIEVGGTLSQVETNKDAGDVTMEVKYTYSDNSDYEPDASVQGKAFYQGGLVSKLIPEHTIQITRLENYNPSPKAKDFVGTVNSGAWSLDQTAAARTWLCTGIVGRSNDGGTTFMVTYGFQYRFDTWDSVVVYLDPRTGRPPYGVDSSSMPSYPDAQKSYQMYTMKNFNQLELPA